MREPLMLADISAADDEGDGGFVGSWDEGGAAAVVHHHGDLTKWVKDRRGRGSKGIMSLHSQAPELMEKGKKGYAGGGALQPRPRHRETLCWDSSTAGHAVPNYDSEQDRHCRSVVASQHYKQNAKRQMYAAEAHKAQRRWGPGSAAAAGGGGVGAAAAEPPPAGTAYGRRSHHAQAASSKALQLMRKKSVGGVAYQHPPTTGAAAVAAAHHHHHQREQVGSTGDGHLPGVFPQPPAAAAAAAGGDSDADAEVESPTKAAPLPLTGRRESAFDPAAVRKATELYTKDVRRKKPAGGGGNPRHARYPSLTRHSSVDHARMAAAAAGPQPTHQAALLSADAAEEVLELRRRGERLEHEKRGLTEQLEGEQAKTAAITARLNNEIQKKVKSTKRASTKDGRVKELAAAAASLTAENVRLRERAKQVEAKAERWQAAEQERRRLGVVAQQKESMYRDLQELLASTEQRLAEYEMSGAEPRARASNLDKTHLRIRLQQEAKTRGLLEKRVSASEAELTKLRQEAQRDVRRRSSAPPPPAAAAAAAAAAGDGSTLAAQLVECQRARDRLLVEAAEAAAAFDAERSQLQAANAQLARREQAAARRAAETEEEAQAVAEGLARSKASLEQSRAESKREVGETRLAAARLEADLRAAKKLGARAATDAEEAHSLRRSLVDDKADMEKICSNLRAQAQRSEKEKAEAAEAAEVELRRRQLGWERDRSELMQQAAKLRMREQEMAAEASIQVDQTKQLRAQLEQIRRKAATEEQTQQHAALKAEFDAVKEQHRSLKAKYDALRGDRNLSQKVSALTVIIFPFVCCVLFVACVNTVITGCNHRDAHQQARRVRASRRCAASDKRRPSASPRPQRGVRARADAFGDARC